MSTIKQVKPEAAALRYEKIVLEYFSNGGVILAVSNDSSFTRMVKFTLGELHLDYKAVFRETTDYDSARVFADKIVERLEEPLLIFVERRIRAKTCIKTVKSLKKKYGPQVRVLVVGTDSSQEEILLAHDIGADSFVPKPISANALIEKMALVIKPGDQIDNLLDRAATLVASGDLELAERVATKVLEIKPRSLKGHMLMGDVARRRGDRTAAERHYQAACKSQKLFIEPLKRLVDLFQGPGDLDKRLTYLSVLDRLSPLNFDHKMELGEVYLGKGDNDKARSYFDEARRMVNRVAADLLGDALMDIARKIGDKDQDLALRFITEAIEVKSGTLSRDDLWMFNNRGILLRRQGKWQEAVENYRKALTVVPHDAGLLYNIGVAYVEGKQYDLALIEFDKALALDPDLVKQTPQVAFNIATAHHRCRNRLEARKYLEAALALNPNFEPAKRLLGYMVD